MVRCLRLAVLMILAAVAVDGCAPAHPWTSPPASPRVRESASPPTAIGAGPVISRGVPAYGTREVYPASQANDSAYSSEARCTPPCHIAYDLSRVPASRRGKVIAAWATNESGFNHELTGDLAYNLPSSYSIDASPAAGGSLPEAGWVTLVSVSGQHEGGRQFALDISGYNWIRFNVQASAGSPGNTDAAFNFDVMDTSQAGADGWFFAGDSITSDAMTLDETYAGGQDGSPNFPQQVNAARPGRFPMETNAGVAFMRAVIIAGLEPAGGAPAHDYMKGWLANFPGRYVTLDYGTNDAAGADPGRFYQAMSILVGDVLTAGKIPILPTIPWNCANDVTPYNQQIARLYGSEPKVVRGPDLYAIFRTNQNYIRGSDCIHPSYPAGLSFYRRQWAQWAIATVYSGS